MRQIIYLIFESNEAKKVKDLEGGGRDARVWLSLTSRILNHPFILLIPKPPNAPKEGESKLQGSSGPTLYDFATSMENNCGRRMCEFMIFRDWCESLKNVFGVMRGWDHLRRWRRARNVRFSHPIHSFEISPPHTHLAPYILILILIPLHGKVISHAFENAERRDS